MLIYLPSGRRELIEVFTLRTFWYPTEGPLFWFGGLFLVLYLGQKRVFGIVGTLPVGDMWFRQCSVDMAAMRRQALSRHLRSPAGCSLPSQRPQQPQPGWCGLINWGKKQEQAFETWLTRRWWAALLCGAPQCWHLTCNENTIFEESSN